MSTCADSLCQSAQPPLVRLPPVVDLGLGAGVQLYVAHLAHRGAAAALPALSFGPVPCHHPPLLFFFRLFFLLLLLSLLTLGRRAAVRPVGALWTLHIWGKKKGNGGHSSGEIQSPMEDISFKMCGMYVVKASTGGQQSSMTPVRAEQYCFFFLFV